MARRRAQFAKALAPLAHLPVTLAHNGGGKAAHGQTLGQQDVDIDPLPPPATGHPAGKTKGEVAVALGGQRVTDGMMRVPAAVRGQLGEARQVGIVRASTTHGDKRLGGQHVQIPSWPQRPQQPA